MKGVFLDFATVSRDDIDVAILSKALPEIDYYPTTAAAALHARIANADVVLTNKIAIDRAAIDAAKNLKLICLAATGTDNVDLDAARERGIAVCNIRGYCTEAVAQHVFSLILALNQHLRSYQKLLRDGAWADSPQFCMLDYPIRELSGSTIGIVGCGALGRAVADLAQCFGMQVLIAARPGGRSSAESSGADNLPRVALDDLLPQADVLSLHCPLTPETQHLIGARELALMPSHGILINTARGALVDESALRKALEDGTIGGAGIDVLSEEPPVNGNPLLDVDLPNLIVTPHIAWASREARQRAIDEMAKNVADFMNGARRHRVV